MLQLIHKAVTVPDDAELFFVGDIHGEYDLLMTALHAVGFNKDKDYCICVGDLIDRGKDNYKVLAKFVYGSERFQAVMGNHDAFMGYAKLEHTFANWIYNGGRWVLDDGLDIDQLDAMGKDIRERLPVFMTVYHRGKTYGVVHGGVPNIYRGNGRQDAGYEGLTRNWHAIIADVGLYVAENPDMGLKDMEYLISPYMWDRDVIKGALDGVNYPPVEGVDYTIHGHSFVQQPFKHHNRIYIDTGGVFNGRLTAAYMHDNKMHAMTTDSKDNFDPLYQEI